MTPDRVIAAVPTAFDADGRVDRRAVTDLLAELEPNVDAVLMAGTTAEFPALTDDERLTLVDDAVGVFGVDRVIAHVGAASADQVHRLMTAVALRGVRRFALLTPYYLPVDGQTVIDWFADAAERLGGGVLYPYLFPDRTGVEVDVLIARKIMALPGVGGLKVSGSASTTVGTWVTTLQPDQQVWSGNDADLVGVLAAGGHGIVSGVSAAFPVLYGRLRDAARSGTLGNTEEVAHATRAVYTVGPTVATLHAALARRTGHPWACRMPAPAVTADQHRAIAALVEQGVDR